MRSGFILGFTGIGLLFSSLSRDVLRKELGWRENGVSDVGFSCPILVFEYVGGGKKVIPTWLGLGTSVGATFTRFVSRALAYLLCIHSQKH